MIQSGERVSTIDFVKSKLWDWVFKRARYGESIRQGGKESSSRLWVDDVEEKKKEVANFIWRD